MLPRSETVELGRSQGKDSVVKLVRAASKPGAIITARIDAAKQIPIRSQQVGFVEQKGSARFLNQWEVEIVDTKDLENIGRR